MRNWSDNWYTKETDQKYMDAARVEAKLKYISKTQELKGGKQNNIFIRLNKWSVPAMIWNGLNYKCPFNLM